MISDLLQKIYITILNPIYSKKISKLAPETRETYLRAIFCFFEIYFILFFSNAFKYILFSHTQRGVLGAIMLLLAAAFSMTGPLHPVKWKKRIFIPILLGAIGLIVTGAMHPIGPGYMSFGFILLLVYPCFYLVWNNRKDYETLFDIVSSANLRVGDAFFIYCIIIYWQDIFSMGRERFRGPVKDPNLYGLIGMAMVCSAMYLIYRKRSGKQRPLFEIISAAAGFTIIILGQSRSAFLVAFGAVIITAIFSFKNSSSGNPRIRIAAIVGVVVLLCVIISVAIINKDKTSEEADSAAAESSFLDRFSFEGKDLNTFTSGRATIWANYANKLNMTGNNYYETDWGEMTGNTVKHAHNNFFEYGYRCGIPVAVAFILMELIAGLTSLKYLFSRKWRRDSYLYVIICMCMYAGMSLIDIATIPMERYAPFAFYLIMTVVLDAEEGFIKDARTE